MAIARNHILVQATNQRSALYKELNTPTDVHFVTQKHHRNDIKIRPILHLTTYYQSEETPPEWQMNNRMTTGRSNQTVDTKLIICIFLCIDSLGIVFHLGIFISSSI